MLALGIGKSSIRDGWCRCLSGWENIKPRLCAEISKCSGLDADALCDAAFFTAEDIRLVEQKAVPSKCVLLCA